MPNIVNVLNFVRGVEPRSADWEPCETLSHEIELNKKHGFPNTILLQYDAMLDKRVRDLLDSTRDDKTEYGVWIEVVKPLVEACGIPWRGREGFAWDWHVDPGFLQAYTADEKHAVCDEVFRLFKELYGAYPRSVGSWMLDSESMRYMADKYEIDAFCICREQWGTDGYTLWGGYYNGAYYPSTDNMLQPAQTREKQVKAPVFRLLGIDPSYSYYEKSKQVFNGIPGRLFTLEPCWALGHDEHYISTLFGNIFDRENLGFGYAQLGQENSFFWRDVGKGLPMQLDFLAGRDDVEVLTLGETGRLFKSLYQETPPTAITALDDFAGNGRQSVWYNCKNYRANLYCDGESVYFRDIQVFDENNRDVYLDAPCRKESCLYTSYPVVDGLRFSDDSVKAGLYLAKGRIEKSENDGGALLVTVRTESETPVTVRFTEESITVATASPLTFRFAKELPVTATFSPAAVRFTYDNAHYTLQIADGRLDGTSLIPKDGRVTLTFDRK